MPTSKKTDAFISHAYSQRARKSKCTASNYMWHFIMHSTKKTLKITTTPLALVFNKKNHCASNTGGKD
jgi:hypothetical protein